MSVVFPALGDGKMCGARYQINAIALLDDMLPYPRLSKIFREYLSSLHTC